MSAFGLPASAFAPCGQGGQVWASLPKAGDRKPLASATLADRRGKVCQLVVHYVEGGGKLWDLKSLCDLTSEKACRITLARIWGKNE